MFTVKILCIGAMKRSPFADLYAMYEKRMQWRVICTECKDDNALMKAISPNEALILLDERGEMMKSTAFSDFIQTTMNNGHNNLQIVIGGADGLPDSLKKHAHKSIALGRQTWPHMMVRVMMMEQLYRAQQILNGHPYHRE